MNSPVDKIKERLSIVDVISSYIKLEPSGANLKAKCPFHNEKTPSFFISPSRGSYYCFGCSAKGDIFTFVEEFEGLDFKGALALLARRAGVPLGPYNPKEESEKDRLYKIMEEATNYFTQNLEKNEAVRKYLKDRGLNEESIASFRVGFIENDWRLLYTHLTKAGFTESEMEKAGLIKKTEKGFYDRFRGRIMFPIADSSGRVIAFSGRIFDPTGERKDEGAKYLNSPDTVLFYKSAVLYGLDKAKDSIRKNNFAILVEGQMDLILSHQAGYKNTVATSGTALSDSTVSKENAVSNLGLVRRLSGNIVLAFDADKAGLAASNRAAKIALALGMDVKVASLPKGVDPADLISKTGAGAWKEAIKNSTHVIEFVLNRILADNEGDSRKVGRIVREEVLPYVSALDSSIEKMHFVKKISDASSIPIGALEEDLKKVEKEAEKERTEIEEVFESRVGIYRKDYIMDRLLGLVLWQKSLAEPGPESDEILKSLARIFNQDIDKILETTKGREQDLIFEAEVFYGKGGEFKKDVAELLGNLEEESLKEELDRKMRELSKADEKKETERSSAILQEISDLNQKIQNIKIARGKK